MNRSVTMTISTPMAQPSPMATPGGILQKYGPAQGIPFPPGMGFTPAAHQLQRTISFGLNAGGTPMSRTISISKTKPVEEQPGLEQTPEEGEQSDLAEGVFPREFLLFFREHVGTNHATSEDAGFLLPQPGWLRTQQSEAPAAPEVKAGGKQQRQGRLPHRATNEESNTSAQASEP